MDSVLNKRWIVEKGYYYSVVYTDEEYYNDRTLIIENSDEVCNHIVALHNKHIDDIESLKAMRDKLCNSDDRG